MRSTAQTLRFTLLAALMVCIGCSRELPTGSVAGKVTFQGKPLAVGTVLLVNPATGIGANAVLDPSGGFRIEGVRTGEYQVAIQRPPAPPPDEMAAGKEWTPSPVPDKYQVPDTSGLTVTINEGENTADFDIP